LPGKSCSDVEDTPFANTCSRVAIAIAEGLLIFLIAIIWRIVSFKYTHLVERLQLLTLIIIGEGIIGMVKSVACITKGQSKNNHTEIGTVIAAVIILVSTNIERVLNSSADLRY
jgi:low temperature requirement protein LtrA